MHGKYTEIIPSIYQNIQFEKVQNNNDVYPIVLIETKFYLVMVSFFLFLWHIWHCWILSLLVFCFVKTFISKTKYLIYVSDRVPSTRWLKSNFFKIYFRQSAKCKKTALTGRRYNVFVNFTLHFTLKTWIFKFRPLFRFLCLSNSFYRRYVPCMCNISNVSNISPMHLIYFLYVQYIQYILLLDYIFGYTLVNTFRA